MQSNLSPDDKSALLQSVSVKQKQAEAALNLALGLAFDVTVAPPEGPAAPVPPESEALTDVSPGQKFEVIAKLHNSSKYWLTVGNATLNHPEWVRQTHADQTTIGPGEDYYANFLVQLPPDAPITRPYWHRDDPQTESINKIDDEAYVTLPFPPEPLHANSRFRNRRSQPIPFSRTGLLKKEGQISSRKEQSPLTLRCRFKDEHGALQKRALAITPAFSVAIEPSQRVIPVAEGNTTTAGVDVSFKSHRSAGRRSALGIARNLEFQA